MRILAIDDEPLLLRLYQRALKGHDVVTADPEEALRLVERDAAFDVVICDFNLPRMRGAWFHDRLIRRAAGLADRLLFCTGGGVDAAGWRILERSPQRVIYKPFDGPHLMRMIESVGAPRPSSPRHMPL